MPRVAFTSEIRKEKLLPHHIFDAHSEPFDFELPPPDQVPGIPWCRWIDTALEPPQDVVPWEQALADTGLSYRAEARWVVALYVLAGPN